MLLVTLLLLGMPFTLRGSGAKSVTQLDRSVAVKEGDSLLLRCNYTYSGTPYLFWYVQYPGQGLQFLLKYYSGYPVVTGSGGFMAEFKKSETSFHLKKASAHWSDTATYYCVVGGTVTEAGGGAGRKPLKPLGDCGDCEAPPAYL